MAGVGRVFQGVEYPSRREACQARHREYVRALADGLKSDRCYSADSALVWGRAELELHAEFELPPVSWTTKMKSKKQEAFHV